MEKRIGYVGLSSPILYDYKTEARRANSDLNSSPNPIIEGAFGAMLLYDELWFLCRSLCPDNMRDLPFVRFMDEANLLPDFDPNNLPPGEEVFSEEAIAAFGSVMDRYDLVKDGARVNWDDAADNHTHSLQVGPHVLTGNSWSTRAVLLDRRIVSSSPAKLELITNSFTSELLKVENCSGEASRLSQSIVLKDVPQYLSKYGPFHGSIEEVRNAQYLSDFRSWACAAAETASRQEIAEVVLEVETKLQEAQREIFLKYLEPKQTYVSVAETLTVNVASAALGAIPFAGSALSLIKDVKDMGHAYTEERIKDKMRWQGFILNARSSIR